MDPSPSRKNPSTICRRARHLSPVPVYTSQLNFIEMYGNCKQYLHNDCSLPPLEGSTRAISRKKEAVKHNCISPCEIMKWNIHPFLYVDPPRLPLPLTRGESGGPVTIVISDVGHRNHHDHHYIATFCFCGASQLRVREKYLWSASKVVKKWLKLEMFFYH